MSTALDCKFKTILRGPQNLGQQNPNDPNTVFEISSPFPTNTTYPAFLSAFPAHLFTLSSYPLSPGVRTSPLTLMFFKIAMSHVFGPTGLNTLSGFAWALVPLIFSTIEVTIEPF